MTTEEEYNIAVLRLKEIMADKFSLGLQPDFSDPEIITLVEKTSAYQKQKINLGG